LMQVFFITPFLIISPFAGVMVDRHNRKMMMMVSDLLAGLATIAVLLLQLAGVLQVWHLYVAAIFQGLGNSFQWPAYSAAISTMIPKEQYGRANGMMSLMEMGPGVFAPMVAGALLPIMGLTGILSIDVVTFILAIFVLAFIHVPQPRRTTEGVQAEGNILQEAVFGFRYIFSRPSLLGLQMVFFFGNLCAGIAFTVLAPMVLLRTGNDSVRLGIVQSAGAIGGVVGGVAMSAWGGFKRRVHGVLAGWIVSSIFFALVGLTTWIPLWIGALSLSALFGPLINGSNQAIWQAKVPPDMQGRVFSARRLIAWLTNPISPIIAGTLADYVLEPAMRTSSGWSSLFGWLIPPGPGAGMSLLIFLGGLGGILAGLIGYFIQPIREAEDILPDYDAVPIAETA
ncbi:MAG TPA: MFS transporter, partial [Anaerolineales bacterium]|nr:MFS transporter [Anaerolineales bacterium]